MKPEFSPFREALPQLLQHGECHEIILHAHNPEAWPLPCSLDEYVSALQGELRRMVEFILMNIEDTSFPTCACALATATMLVNTEGSSEDRGEVV